MKKIEIICNRKVRDYVTSRLKSLTGLSVSQAYDLLKNEGCLPIAECADILKRGQLLLKMIDSFKFPASIPVRPVDDRHLWQFRERWSKHLQGLLDKMVARSKPVYLADEVNKQLKRRKSSIQCSRVHLIWYLDVYGEENMNPESIATAIIKFGVTDWSKVQPLVGNSKYSITITDENMEVDQDEFRHLVEFIWDIPTSNTQNNLIEMIQNDVKVLEDFRKLWESAPRTYDYKRVFEEYVSRLQTLPPSKKRISLKKDHTKKGKDDEQLTPDAQLALVRKHECPICGHQLIQKISDTTGKYYLGHESGNACHYIAWGTFDSPSIHEKYDMTISRNGIMKTGT